MRTLLAVCKRVSPTYNGRSTGCIWHRDIQSVSASRILLLSCFESASRRLWSFADIREMATIAQNLPESHRPLAWFREFLKEELTPYPGRFETVARMVLATTLVMIICMTFRI